MRKSLIVAVVLSLSFAARAEPSTELELRGGGFSVLGFGAPYPSIGVGVGFESGQSVWLLGVGAAWGRNQTEFYVLDGNGVFAKTMTTQQGWSVALEPGYRRYLTTFESGFAPFVEGRVRLGYGWASPDVQQLPQRNAYSNFIYGASVAFGGEVRFHEHFALTGNVGLNGNGSFGSRDSEGSNQSVSIDTSLGWLFRF